MPQASAAGVYLGATVNVSSYQQTHMYPGMKLKPTRLDRLGLFKSRSKVLYNICNKMNMALDIVLRLERGLTSADTRHYK